MSSHWYDHEGKPRYTVPYASGKGERATNLGDARKLKLFPSVTTILGIVDKPALTRWKINEVLEAAIEMPYEPLNSMFSHDWEITAASNKWKSTIIKMSEKKGKDAADRGNAIHDGMEQYFTVGLMRNTTEEVRKFCTPAIELIADTFGHMANWNAEHSFSHKLGFGGKCDLHMLPCGEYPNGVIIDFKTKSAEDFSKVKAYSEQCQQLVAYRQGFGMPHARCFNLFIGTNTPGELMLHEWREEECQSAWKCFTHLVEYWKTINNFEVYNDLK